VSGHELLGTVPPLDLAPARVALHHAAQLAAAVGHTLLPKRDDVSQSSLHVEPALGALVGEPFGERAPRTASLLIREFALEVELARFPLAGRTLGGGLDWLARTAAEEISAAGRDAIELPGFDLPPHDVERGGVFEQPDERQLDELARWFSFAQLELDHLSAAHPGASPVRSWPHHFDTALLLPVEGAGEGGAERSIGVGLSPGDETYAQPYWYVNPWPPPAVERLPAIEGRGAWHAVDWVGAVLTAEDLIAAGDVGAQVAALRAFLDEAIPAARKALG